jgi:hypothetical protein
MMLALRRDSRLTPANAPAESAYGLREKPEKLRALGVVVEDVLPFIAAVRDVVRQPGLVKCQWSRREFIPNPRLRSVDNLLQPSGFSATISNGESKRANAWTGGAASSS